MDINILRKLQKQSNIKLNTQEEEQFMQDFDSMIQLLDSMSNFSDEVELKNVSDVTLRTISQVEEFPNTKDILSNSEHELINNSIVIKSVM